MDYLAPLIFDVFNIDMGKFKMNAYLKALELHVYLAITKKSYINNGKYLEANTQAIDALKYTLSKEYISLISHCDSTFAVWNTLTSFKEQKTNILEKEPLVDESDEACYMVQGNDSFEVTSECHLDDCTSSSDDHDSSMDAHILNKELSIFCENLLSKYKVLKSKNFDLQKEKLKVVFKTWFDFEREG